jgi:hypothetical protein
MARKTKSITIMDENRDKGKTFVITEMPADQAEQWAIRLLLALKQSGANLPDGIEELGMAGMAAMGIRAALGMQYEIVRPLLAEMMDCVKYQSEHPAVPPSPIGSGINCLVEEVSTFFMLRQEIVNLHLGFSTPDVK